ncbi:MAG: Holliday junction branch migration protein RuvA [Bacteroides sp.]|nr:Holliday junction branch migration protein RuvA [Bacteroides sp.]MCM1379412.1 Holliday junction branch migration protein RuvA [Bacteroides sp.]MCM1445272.1 Holliday junction branch migration protein RuvA [Prevotella sp.]
MIEYIKGQLAHTSPTEAVVEAAGVGYLLNISVNTYSAISKLTEVKLLVHEIIREDTHDLFGFFSAEERALFRLLIGVSGVGPNTARVILSSLSASQLKMCILAGDTDKLKAIKGIGLKTAQRLIVDLKDKVNAAELAAMAGDAEAEAMVGAVDSEARAEALAALVMLGYQKAQAQKALAKVFGAEPTATVEVAIKRALSML